MLKLFKSKCIDFTKPDKPELVKPTNERAVFDAPETVEVQPGKIFNPLSDWASLPMYSYQRAISAVYITQ